MKFSNFFKSTTFKTTLMIIGVVLILLAGIALGENIGFHKASFTFQNGDNFYHTFGPGTGNGSANGFSDTHGTVGKVISIALPTITIEDRDHTEKTIVVTPQTIVRQLRNTLTVNDIKTGDFIVAIGDPNAQSQIVAILIRELPPPPPDSADATTGKPKML